MLDKHIKLYRHRPDLHFLTHGNNMCEWRGTRPVPCRRTSCPDTARYEAQLNSANPSLRAPFLPAAEASSSSSSATRPPAGEMLLQQSFNSPPVANSEARLYQTGTRGEQSRLLAEELTRRDAREKDKKKNQEQQQDKKGKGKEKQNTDKKDKDRKDKDGASGSKSSVRK